MKVILFDRREKQVGRLIPNLVTPREIEDLNGLNRFVFTYPAIAEWAGEIRDGYYVAIQDLDNDWQLYEITKVGKNITGTQSMLEVECDHAYYALAEEEYVALNIQGQSAYSALSQVLGGTGWQPGVVQVTGTRTISTQPIKRLVALRQLEQSWECELHYRVQISGVSIHAKYVDMLIRRGSHTGKRYTFGRDLIGINLTVDKSNVVTALYGFGPVLHLPEEGEEGGEERLTLADVEWVKGQPAELYPGGPSSPAPVDKPLGQFWIGDEDAREIYGRLDASTQKMVHVFDEYSSSAQSPQALAWETWRQLQKRVTPLWHAEATVAALEQVPGFEHERVRLGDTNYAILPNMLPIEGRIILIDRQRKSPDQTMIEMGNFRPVQSDADLEMEKRQQRVDSRSGIWDRAAVITPNRRLPTSVLDGVIDAAVNQLLAGGGSFVADGDGAWVYDTSDASTALGAICMVAHEGQAAVLLAKRPSPISPWNARVGFTTEGFKIFGEEVIGGILRGGQLIGSQVEFDLENGTFRIGQALFYDGQDLIFGEGAIRWENLDLASRENLKGEDAYRVEILSSQGNYFRVGQVNTILSARVYKGSEDITDSLDPNQCRWTRVSEDPAGDEIWNQSNYGGTKQLVLTPEDVTRKATFTCTILKEAT